MKSQNSNADNYDIKMIIKSLLSGEVASVPTETVEGYAVLLNNPKAIQKLMKLKDRDFNSGKIFTLAPESTESIKNYVMISEKVKQIINNYIPGELTLILPKNPDFKNYYYDHFDTIGIRIPKHQLFNQIQKEVGPMILTSANPRGGTPKTLTGHLPSTIIDFTGKTPKIIRQGNLQINL